MPPEVSCHAVICKTAGANEQGGHLTTRNRAEITALTSDHRLQYKRSHIQ